MIDETKAISHTQMWLANKTLWMKTEFIQISDDRLESLRQSVQADRKAVSLRTKIVFRLIKYLTKLLPKQTAHLKDYE